MTTLSSARQVLAATVYVACCAVGVTVAYFLLRSIILTCCVVLLTILSHRQRERS